MFFKKRLMSDCEGTEFLCCSHTSPMKRKRKKGPKKDVKRPQCKDKIAMATAEKKKCKSKEAMTEKKKKKKKKKKEKKTNENRVALEVDDTYPVAQCSSPQAEPAVKPEPSSPHCNEELRPDDLTQDSKKRKKRKKTLEFNLPQGCFPVKRPKFSPSSLRPRVSIPSENEAVRDSESCSQVTVTGLSLGYTHDNNSQCPSEDINSQDLFITQKTFRVSPSQTSSDEACDTVITATPQVFTQGKRHLHTSEVQIKQHLEDSHVHQQHREPNKHVEKQTMYILITDEEKEGGEEESQRKRKLSHHKQTDLNAYLVEEKEPVVSKPSPDVTKKHSSMTSTSTQTENFFTTELSSYLDFRRKTRVTAHLKDLKPLDLSMLQEVPLSVVTSPSLPGEVRGDSHEDPSVHPSRSSDVKDVEVQREACGRAQSKGKATVSPQSESELKFTDMAAFTEDNEPLCRSGKLDLTQVRAVQMRLNESFFFKTKGEPPSPRPASPLMNVAQSKEVKNRRGH